MLPKDELKIARRRYNNQKATDNSVIYLESNDSKAIEYAYRLHNKVIELNND